MKKIFYKLKQLNLSKKTILCILIPVFLLSVFIGYLFMSDQQETSPSLHQIVEEKIVAYETDLQDSLVSIDRNQDLVNYLVSWGKSKNISVTSDSLGNVIYQLSSTSEKYEGESLVLILCEYNASHVEDYLNSIVTCMTIARNAEEHRACEIIFTPVSNGSRIGIENVSKRIASKDAQILVLGDTSSSKVSTLTGGYCEYRLTEKLECIDTEYDKAYKITIQGIPPSNMNGKMNGIPNPIKTLGNLLANLKSTSLLFELSNFTGGSNSKTIPKKASMTIVINNADEAKFIKKMDAAIEKFYDKYSEAYPSATYTYEVVDLPKKVFSQSCTDSIVSLMYTAFHGVYDKDDDGNAVAITNVGKLTANENRLKLLISTMSYSDDYLDEISQSYQTISGLCNFKYKKVSQLPIYSASEVSLAFQKEFERAFLEFTGDEKMTITPTVELTSCTLLAEQGIESPMFYCGISEKTKEKFAGSIITFLGQSAEE